MSKEELEAARQELARNFIGWHRCGMLVPRSERCPACGPTTAADRLALDDPWVAQLPALHQHLVSAVSAGQVRARVRATLEASARRRGGPLIR